MTINLSDKQYVSVQNMHRFLGYDENNIPMFETYEEFNEYFKGLQIKCKSKRKKANFRIKVQKGEIVLKDYSVEKLERYAINLIEKYGLYSEYKLKTKLKTKSSNKDDISIVVKKLKRIGYINDEIFVESKTRKYLYSGKGAYHIKSKLYQSGIKVDITDLNISEEDEFESLKYSADKLIKKYNINDYKEKCKLMQKLSAKGFSYGLISKYLKELE